MAEVAEYESSRRGKESHFLDSDDAVLQPLPDEDPEMERQIRAIYTKDGDQLPEYQKRLKTNKTVALKEIKQLIKQRDHEVKMQRRMDAGGFTSQGAQKHEPNFGFQ
jgi:hypothetical protein